MERSGIDKLKKACIILPLVVAVIFNSSVAAIDRENNSKLSCGILCERYDSSRRSYMASFA